MFSGLSSGNEPYGRLYQLDSYHMGSLRNKDSFINNENFKIFLKFNEDKTLELRLKFNFVDVKKNLKIDTIYCLKGVYKRKRKIKFVFIPMDVKIGSLYRNVSYSKRMKNSNNRFLKENATTWEEVINIADSNVVASDFTIFVERVISSLSQNRLKTKIDKQHLTIKNRDDYWIKFNIVEIEEQK